MQHRTRNRAAFTLLEVMIAMALTLFVMVILSQAFVSSLDTFSGMKGIGDMQQALRTATVLLTDDLASDHFDGKRRLSDVDAAGNQLIVTQKPQAGFFAVKRGSAPSLVGPGYIFEGSDASGMPSYRAVDQMLYMTVKRKGNRQENFFTTKVGGTGIAGEAAALGTFFGPNLKTAYFPDSAIPQPELQQYTWTQQYTGGSTAFYSSQWAEVLWYLIQTGTTDEPNNPSGTTGTPTYGLYRSQFVMVPDSSIGWQQPGTATTRGVSDKFANAFERTFWGISCRQGGRLTFFSPADAALGQRMIPNFLAFLPTTANPLTPGSRASVVSTLVCPNVTSFHIQVMPLGSTAFIDVPNNGTYDTTQFSVAGYPVGGIKGISVTLRVWDHGTRQTRQTTVVQDL